MDQKAPRHDGRQERPQQGTTIIINSITTTTMMMMRSSSRRYTSQNISLSVAVRRFVLVVIIGVVAFQEVVPKANAFVVPHNRHPFHHRQHSFHIHHQQSQHSSVLHPSPSLLSQKEKDSLERFEQDITNVIKRIRNGPDATVPEFFRERFPAMSMTYIWDNQAWDRQLSRWRYIRDPMYILKSRIWNRILPQWTVAMIWSWIVCNLVDKQHLLVQKMHISISSLGLVSTFVAALLTLRSNQGLNRLAEARVAWGRIVAMTRDTAQCLAVYVYPQNPELGLLSARHLSMFGWLLKCRLREEDDQDIINAMLGIVPQDLEYISSQRKRSVVGLHRIRQIVAHVASSSSDHQSLFPPVAHLQLQQNLWELNRMFGRCERLKGSSIPPMYTSHVTRLLVFYIVFLPFALASSGVSRTADLVTTGAVAFAMMGLDEIGHILEQPFRLMPIHHQSINVMTDVADAFVCQPPPIPVDDDDDDDDDKDRATNHRKNLGVHSSSSSSLDFQYPFGTGFNTKPEYW